MRKALPAALMLVVALSLILADVGMAKRFGSGRSFGSKPGFSKSFSKPSTTRTSPAGNTMGRTGQPRRPGFFSGPFGFLGGMLAGGLIGSLLFGGGFGGINFMDILLIGLVIYFGAKFLRRRRSSQADMTTSTGQTVRTDHPYERSGQDPGSAWDNLRSTPADSEEEASGYSGQAEASQIPADFDQEDFLKGAKVLFTRMQTSWDKRDLNDIRQFTSDEVYNEVKAQAQEDPGPSTTEILLINAKVLEVKKEGQETMATVYYDVVMREDPNQSATSQVREVWHFIKTGPDSMWTLEGIQQLED